MEFIKEDQILLYEELCAKTVDGHDELTKATIRFRENVKLANHIASKTAVPRDPALDRDDIVQAAYEGLWMACLKFDESLGYTFSTYAVPTIRGSIWRMLRENEALKTPRYFKDMRHALYSHGFTLPLTDEEIDILVSEGKFSRAQIMEYSEPSITSLDSPINDSGDSSTYGEIIADNRIKECEISEDEIEAIIDKIIMYIKPIHRDLVEEWMYATLSGTKLTQKVLGTKYNLSQVQVSRILNVAISTVRMFHGDEIRELLGV